MLLSITTTHHPATDMGYLLQKNPNKLHTISLSFGKAHVFYPEATASRCTAALLLEVDPVGLVRKNTPSGQGFALEQYVNDRPYVASSFLSVAIINAFGTLLAGKCKQRPELIEQTMPLSVNIPVMPCRGGEKLLRKLFEPLGYEVEATEHILDEKFPEWGNSVYYSVNLHRECSLREFLVHLYVLIPVLDNDKHYWINEQEIEKLLRYGEGWLDSHPDKTLITQRYLKNFKSLTKIALTQLSEEQTASNLPSMQEDALEQKINLNQERINWVVNRLKQLHVKSVLDLGCGEGKILKPLFADHFFDYITGADVSLRALAIAKERLHYDDLSSMQQRRINFIQTALTYRDKRLKGYDAAILIEVIEHIDAVRLAACRRAVFEFAKPSFIIVTTPNVEYNVLFENLPPGKFRHSDHRFEWTRAEFQAWALQAAEDYGYSVTFEEIGQSHELYGSPTQAGVFRKNG